MRSSTACPQCSALFAHRTAQHTTRRPQQAEAAVSAHHRAARAGGGQGACCVRRTRAAVPRSSNTCVCTNPNHAPPMVGVVTHTHIVIVPAHSSPFIARLVRLVRRCGMCLLQGAENQTQNHSIYTRTYTRAHAHTHTRHQQRNAHDRQPQQMKSEPVLGEREALPALSLHVRTCKHVSVSNTHARTASV